MSDFERASRRIFVGLLGLAGTTAAVAALYFVCTLYPHFNDTNMHVEYVPFMALGAASFVFGAFSFGSFLVKIYDIFDDFV